MAEHKMPAWKAPSILTPGGLSDIVGGGVFSEPAKIRNHMTPEQALEAGKRNKSSFSNTTTAPNPAPAAAQPALNANVVGAINTGNAVKDKYNTAQREQVGRNQQQDDDRWINSGPRVSDQDWNNKIAAFHGSRDDLKTSVTPASGAYNYAEDMRGREQNEYWANRLAEVNARSQLRQGGLSAQDQLAQTALLTNAQAGLRGASDDRIKMAGHDATRYGHDAQRYGHDTQLAGTKYQSDAYTDQQRLRNTGAIAVERLKQTDPEALARTKYTGAQTEKARFDMKNAPAIARAAALAAQNKDAAGVVKSYAGQMNATPEKIVALTKQMQGGRSAPTTTYSVSEFTGKILEGNPDATQEQIDATLAKYAGIIRPDAPDAPEGYADGDYVSPDGPPQGAIQAQPTLQSMAPQQTPNPDVLDYKRYVLVATEMRATPVPFEQFASLRSAARGMPAAPATQYLAGGGVVGYNGDGNQRVDVNAPATGAVNRLKQYGGVGRQQQIDGAVDGPPPAQGTQRTAAPAPAPAPAPTKSYEQIDAEREAARQRMRDSQRPFYEKIFRAEGGDIPPESGGQGAIPVAGKHVIGAGDGKSDSIPAIIDGQRPAALSTGEFVMPVETVQFFGLDKLRKMIAQSRKGDEQPQG